jgi:hypothetical protein
MTSESDLLSGKHAGLPTTEALPKWPDPAIGEGVRLPELMKGVCFLVSTDVCAAEVDSLIQDDSDLIGSLPKPLASCQRSSKLYVAYQ